MKPLSPRLVAVVLAWLGPLVLASAANPPPPSNPQVDKLAAVLNSGAPQKEKADACRELARIGTKEAVASLSTLLADEKLSHMARYGLETIPDPSVDLSLRGALTKLQGPALVGVIGSVGVRKDVKAVPPLATLLLSADPDVAQAAARALGAIGDIPSANALENALASLPLANQTAAYEGLFRCAESLAAKGQPARAIQIYDRLRTNQTRHQIRAAALRGSILNRKDGLALLTQVLHTPNYALFEAAAHVALEMPGSEVTRSLATELPSLYPNQQIVILQILGRRSDPRALPAVLNAARNSAIPVRLAAIRCLAELDDPAAAPVLFDLLSDPNPEIVRQAQETLASLQGQTIDDAIGAMLASDKPAWKITGMELAVRRRMQSAVFPMFKAAAGTDQSLRLAALKKLPELCGPSELPTFLNLLAKAVTAQDLEAAEQGLGVICVRAADPDHCAQTLAARWPEADAQQRCALLRVLGTVGGSEALKSVRTALQDTNTNVRATAVRVLGGWSTLEAAPDLLALAQAANDPIEKTLCLRSYLGLAGHPDFPADQRLLMCRQAAGLVQKDEEKKLLLAALATLNSPEALNLAKPFLEEETTKEEAALATVSVSEKILQGGEASKLAAKLVEPLENVTHVSANTELVARAVKLAEEAKTRSNSK